MAPCDASGRRSASACKHRSLLARLVILALISTCGCSANTLDRQEVEAVAIKRQQALVSKDLALYLSIVSPAYNDKGKDFAAERKELEANFSAYDRIGYRSLERRIEVSGTTATVSGKYRLTITSRGNEISLEGEERLRLAKEADGWKIIGGL